MTKAHEDIVVESLKRRYFDVLRLENYPKTPDLTKEADRIEEAIKKVQNGTAFPA